MLLDVKPDVVTRSALLELFVMHFNGLDFSGDVCGSEGDDHSSLDDTSFNTTNRHSSDTADFVNVLERETEGLVVRSSWRLDGIDGVEECLALDNAGFRFLRPTLEPRHAEMMLMLPSIRK